MDRDYITPVDEDTKVIGVIGIDENVLTHDIAGLTDGSQEILTPLNVYETLRNNNLNNTGVNMLLPTKVEGRHSRSRRFVKTLVCVSAILVLIVSFCVGYIVHTTYPAVTIVQMNKDIEKLKEITAGFTITNDTMLEWTNWSQCNGGLMSRSRQCSTPNGLTCIGKDTDYALCDV